MWVQKRTMKSVDRSIDGKFRGLGRCDCNHANRSRCLPSPNAMPIPPNLSLLKGRWSKRLVSKKHNHQGMNNEIQSFESDPFNLDAIIDLSDDEIVPIVRQRAQQRIFAPPPSPESPAHDHSLPTLSEYVRRAVPRRPGALATLRTIKRIRTAAIRRTKLCQSLFLTCK